MSVGIEETACQVVAHLQRGSLAKEGNLGIGGDTAGTLKHLQGNVVAHNLYHLGQTAVDGCQFVITHALRLQGACGLGYLAYLCIYFLKCCCHTLYIL